MKKFISIAAAAVTALNCAALSAGAVFEDIPSKRIWDQEIEMFSAMDAGSLVIDIDRDGKFDLTDCFLLYSYTNGYDTAEDIAEYADSAADYDGNGVVDENDAVHLTRYYIVNNKLTREETQSSYYNSINKHIPVDGEGNGLLSGFSFDMSLGRNFAKLLLTESAHLLAGYQIFCDMLENGEIDYDVNGDGKVWFDDINYVWVYSINRGECQYMDFTMAEAAYIPGQMIYPCQKVYEYLCFDIGTPWIWEYALMYCFENYGTDPQYLSNDYYESVFAGSGKYDFGEYAKQCYQNWLPQNEYLDFKGAYFNREYLAFVKDIADGTAAIPDTNGDGVLDITDTFNTCIYMDDLYAEADAETTILPENVWKFFTEGCDINGNGLSGDIHDLNILTLYSTEGLGNEAMFEFFSNYSEKLKAYIESLSKESGVPAVKYSPEKYASPISLSDDMERTGDANADGIMDLSDTVMVMQALANPNKYQLSAFGRFNADVNNTGDGVTVNDALSIQYKLLGLE